MTTGSDTQYASVAEANTVRLPQWLASVGRGELTAWAGILTVALGTRLWDLGGRAMHYDEVLHVYYSWRYAEGMGYVHTPLTHGPFLFHANALVYLLLGANDVTSRLLPALFGVVLVGLPFLLRRELGRYGALATAVLLLVSPVVLYVSRFIRDDIYMAVYMVGAIIVMWRYREQPRTRLLVAWAALWALAFSTLESAFLLAGIFGLYLLLFSGRHFWEWVRGRAKLSDLPPGGALLLVLATVTAPLWAPFSGAFQDLFGIILVNPDANDPRVISGELFRAGVPTGSPAGGALYIAAFLVGAISLIAIGLGLLWDRRRWPLLVAVFVAIWLPLHTSLFTNWDGFFTGLWGSLAYWMAQQGVERASQPHYYYIVTMSTYEFLMLAPALAGGACLLVRGKATDYFLVYFAFMSFVLFSYAGERMPWLTLGIAYPTALVAGRAMGMLVESARGTYLAPAAFLAGLGLMVMVPFALFRAVSAPSPVGDAGLWLAVFGTLLVVAAALYVGRRLMLSPAAYLADLPLLRRPHVLPALAAVGLGALTAMLGLTVVTSARAAYSYGQYERPTELIVYSQTGQETPYAAECIERVARESGRGPEGLRFLIGEADNFAWQWRWYLRDYPDANVTYRSLGDQPLSSAPEADFILISEVDRLSLEPRLDGFTRVGGLHHLWWFPNWAYGGLGPGKVLAGATDRGTVHRVLDYFFTRTWDGTSMFRSTGHVYVSNELAALARGCTGLRDAAP